MTNPYPPGPSPARLQPLSIPPMQTERPQHASYFTHRYAPHPPTQNFPPPATQANPSRWPPAAPLDRLLHTQEDTPPGSSSAYSSGYGSQTSPLATDSQRTLQRRRSPFDNAPIPGISELVPSQYNVPQLPSPSFTTHRGSVESHCSSATSSSGLRPSPITLPGVSTALPEATQSSTTRYRLTVRQQPIAARACGFGERDRRVIDPPPIVQMSLADFDPSSQSDLASLRYPFNVVHCALLHVSSLSSGSSHSPSATNADVTAIPDPSTNKLTRRLMGTLVASPFVGNDPEASGSGGLENSKLGCFFIFPDLSCRQHGLYKLRFTLMSLGAEITHTGGRASVVGSVESDVFEVYSAKDFPGMRASTTLTRELKKQGAGVSVKKGNEGKVGRKGRKRADSESASDSEVSDSNRRKRSKD
ncbi:Velvet factor [Lasallia pustulata]|nr:Velvet factor [Lasallia pustulata]